MTGPETLRLAEPMPTSNAPSLVRPTSTSPRRVAGRHVTRAVLLLLLLVAIAAAAPTDRASAAAARTTVPAVEAKLMCITCRTPLNQSTSGQADDERADVQGLIARGYTEDQVLDRMVAIYGRQILIDPPQHGVRALRLVVPAVAALLAVGLGVVLVRRWRRRGRADAPGVGPPDPEDGLSRPDEDRLASDLARYE